MKSNLTVMNRWKSAKKRFPVVAEKAFLALQEAGEIIRKKTGQDIFFKRSGYIFRLKNGAQYFENKVVGVGYLQVGNQKEVLLSLEVDGNRVFYGAAEVGSKKSHWNMSLSTVERLIYGLENITTGDILAAWEREQ